MVKYIPTVLFCIYGIKSLIVSPTLIDSAILLILGSIFVILELQNKEKQFLELQNKMTELSNNFNKLEKSVEETKTHVSGLKLSQQMRTVNVR